MGRLRELGAEVGVEIWSDWLVTRGRGPLATRFNDLRSGLGVSILSECTNTEVGLHCRVGTRGKNCFEIDGSLRSLEGFFFQLIEFFGEEARFVIGGTILQAFV